jgi:hypothetical protein
MIEITYTHIYMLTPTPEVMQNIHPSTKNKYSKVQRDLSVFHQRERPSLAVPGERFFGSL